jgi:hypothetical protein
LEGEQNNSTSYEEQIEDLKREVELLHREITRRNEITHKVTKGLRVEDTGRWTLHVSSCYSPTPHSPLTIYYVIFNVSFWTS